MRERFRTIGKTTLYIILIGVVGWILYAVYLIIPKWTVSSEYWQKKGFKTDTSITNNYYTLPEIHLPNQVPPKTVINYYQSQTSNKLVYGDSLIKVLDSMGKQLAIINSKYLKLFPTNAKLIRGKFDRDSLSLDLLNTNGEFQTLNYGVNYQKFRYQFINGKMEAIGVNQLPGKTPLFSNLPTSKLYGEIGYSWLDHEPELGLIYQLQYQKLLLSNKADIMISKQPTLIISTNLGYQLTR